jgi:type VI secretion system protein ImpJ
MKPEKPLFWHQGLFLQPQHFQQFELYCSSLTAPLHMYTNHWFWGVIKLHLDDEQLKNGVVVIDKGEFVFPDRTWVAAPENAVVLSRILDRKKFEPHKPFMLFAAVQQLSRTKANVTGEQNPEILAQAGVRYVADKSGNDVVDLHEYADPGTVAKLNHIVKIFVESEIEHLGDYSTVPIAQLEYDGERFVQYSDFAPPALTLASSPVLLRIARSIADQLLAASRKLEQYKIPRDSLMQSNAEYYIYMLGLLILNRYVPLLYHFLSSPSCHPFDYFGTLRQIIGELSSFTDRHGCLADLPDGTRLLNNYDHNDSQRCYNQAAEIIATLLRSLMTGPENTIPFTHDADGGYSAVLPLSIFEHSSQFYLQVCTSVKLERILTSVNDSIKIGSSQTITDLVSRSLPGLKVEYVKNPPPGIPRRSDTHCFRVDHLHEQWNEIQKNRSMCIYWDHASSDTSFELIVIRS